jgi:hypothetical protein
MSTNKNHGGANFAEKKGSNRKAEARYDGLALDYNVMVAGRSIGNGHREANGYTKPGSRKKIGG